MCGGVRVVAAGAIDVFKILPSSNSLIMIVSVSTEKKYNSFWACVRHGDISIGFSSEIGKLKWDQKHIPLSALYLVKHDEIIYFVFYICFN